MKLTFACGDYDRTQPLIHGTVKPEGFELNWLTLPHHEIWTRMLNDWGNLGGRESFLERAGSDLKQMPLFFIRFPERNSPAS